MRCFNSNFYQISDSKTDHSQHIPAPIQQSTWCYTSSLHCQYSTYWALLGPVLFLFKPSSLSFPKFTIPSCATLLSHTTAQSQNIRACFVSLRTVPHYTVRQRAKQAVPVAIKSSLAAGGDLSLPAHQWNLLSVTPTVTHPSAKAPHSYLVPQAFPFWRIPNIAPKLSSCAVPASTSQCSWQCSAPVCSRQASVSVWGSLGPRICTALGHASVTRNAASAACVLRGGIYLL